MILPFFNFKCVLMETQHHITVECFRPLNENVCMQLQQPVTGRCQHEEAVRFKRLLLDIFSWPGG